MNQPLNRSVTVLEASFKQNAQQCEHSLYVTCIFSKNNLKRKSSQTIQKFSDIKSLSICPNSAFVFFSGGWGLDIFRSKVQGGDDATHQVCYTTNTPSVKYAFFHAHALGCRLDKWMKIWKYNKLLFSNTTFWLGVKTDLNDVEWLNALFFVHKWTSCTLSLPIRLWKASLDALATTPKMKAKAAGVLIPEWPAAISWKSNSKVCPGKDDEKRTKRKEIISKN